MAPVRVAPDMPLAVRDTLRPRLLPDIQAMIPDFPQTFRNPFQIPELPSVPSLPTLPDMDVPLQAGLFSLEFLVDLGVPPEVVGVLSAAFMFKIPIIIIITGIPAVYYTAVNRPRYKLTEEILERNKVLPPLLEHYSQLNLSEIQTLEDAKDVSDHLFKLNPYAAPHYKQRRFISVKPGQKSPWERIILTRPFYRLWRGLRMKVHRYFDNSDKDMGPNERIDKLKDSQEIKNQIILLLKKLLAYKGSKRRLWHRFVTWMRNAKWNETNYYYLAPEERVKENKFLKTLSALKRTMHDLHQIMIRNMAINAKGKAWIPDYDSPEFAPKSIAESVKTLSGLITRRIDVISAQLKHSEDLSPEKRSELLQEIQLYADTVLDFDGIGEEQRAQLIQIERNGG